MRRFNKKICLYLAIFFYTLFQEAIPAFGFIRPDPEELLLNALILTESGNNPLAVEETANAKGLTQIRAPAWSDLVRYFPEKYANLNFNEDIFNPEIARQAGRDYLIILKYYLAKKKLSINLDNLLAAYNWGIGNLEKLGLENAPQETKSYIKKIKVCLAEPARFKRNLKERDFRFSF